MLFRLGLDVKDSNKGTISQNINMINDNIKKIKSKMYSMA